MRRIIIIIGIILTALITVLTLGLNKGFRVGEDVYVPTLGQNQEVLIKKTEVMSVKYVYEIKYYIVKIDNEADLYDIRSDLVFKDFNKCYKNITEIRRKNEK